MDDELFQRMIDATSNFDALDLLTSIAALQLMPGNISRSVRLEVLAHATAVHAVHTDPVACLPNAAVFDVSDTLVIVHR